MPVIVDTGRQRTVVVSAKRIAAIRVGQGRGTSIEARGNVNTVAAAPNVLEVGTRGLQGKQGEPGDDFNALFEVLSGEAISSHRVVKVVSERLRKVDSNTVADANVAVGITVTSTSGADQTQTVRNDGPMTDPGWNWVPGPIYCGPNGVLTQTPPASGFVCEVARAKTATEILVDIQPPIIRG